MKVFLSWSGNPSLKIARALRDWIPNVLSSVEPWMSEEDITMGARWTSKLAKELKETTACIVCLTPENLSSTWLHFEAGEVARIVRNSLVCPYLVGVKKSELVGPLSLFQAAVADRTDTLRLVKALNDSQGGPGISPDRLNKMFEVWWPHLDAELRNIEIFPYGLSFDAVKNGIAALIDSSNLPMYFLDSNCIVQHCNQELASLIDSEPAAIIGKTVSELIQRFGRRVVESR